MTTTHTTTGDTVTTTHDPIAAVAALVEGADECGNGTLSVEDVRAALEGRADLLEWMSPGDVEPKRGVVASDLFIDAVRSLSAADNGSHPAILSAAESAAILITLRSAGGVLTSAGKAALVVKGALSTPYPDRPDRTPWVQFMERPARAAYNLGIAIRRVVNAARDGKPVTP